jgi:hypothetical protein
MAEQRDNDREAFLSRWSRRKLEAPREAQAPRPETPTAAAAPAAKADERARESQPDLPPLEKVGIDTDFSAFMGKEVEEGVRRAALKKLFADPRFNVMDGLDTYIDDYTQAETISAEMLATLEHAKHTLLGPQPEEKDETQDSAAAQTASPNASETSSAQNEIEKKPESEDGAAG